jgi:Uncharacterised nucleotidyltransferase
MRGTALPAAQLPAMAAVAAALRATTERLAGELAGPRAAAPDWTDFEWRTARAVSAMHGISGLLAGKLVWSGPEGWVEFLSRQRQHIAQRQCRTQELLASVGEHFRLRGIPVQALKGAALYHENLYQQGQRPMADLDLLVSPVHGAQAGTALQELGLRESHRTFKHRIFEAPRKATRQSGFGEHTDNVLKVELHDRICESLPYRLVDISSLLSPLEPRPGLNPYPSRAALMAHLLLHAAGAMAFRTLRMVQLHDIALLASRLTAGDWQQLVAWGAWWGAPPVMLAERYYGAITPSGFSQTLRSACPPMLRYACTRQLLSDVSLSHLWLEAFPGLEWTRSAAEALVFVFRRIKPSAEVRADRRFALATDPSLAQGDWGRLSQRRRIMRAMRARTPRPWPLHNVREALAEPR